MIGTLNPGDRIYGRADSVQTTQRRDPSERRQELRDKERWVRHEQGWSVIEWKKIDLNYTGADRIEGHIIYMDHVDTVYSSPDQYPALPEDSGTSTPQAEVKDDEVEYHVYVAVDDSVDIYSQPDDTLAYDRQVQAKGHLQKGDIIYSRTGTIKSVEFVRPGTDITGRALEHELGWSLMNRLAYGGGSAQLIIELGIKRGSPDEYKSIRQQQQQAGTVTYLVYDVVQPVDITTDAGHGDVVGQLQPGQRVYARANTLTRRSDYRDSVLTRTDVIQHQHGWSVIHESQYKDSKSTDTRFMEYVGFELDTPGFFNRLLNRFRPNRNDVS